MTFKQFIANFRLVKDLVSRGVLTLTKAQLMQMVKIVKIISKNKEGAENMITMTSTLIKCAVHAVEEVKELFNQ